jgi:hypothetical protein
LYSLGEYEDYDDNSNSNYVAIQKKYSVIEVAHSTEKHRITMAITKSLSCDLICTIASTVQPINQHG